MPMDDGHAAPPSGAWRFTLYVFGQDGRSQHAAARIQLIGDTALGGCYELVVVDVVKRPDLAEAARVWLTPTLVREAPAPRIHVVGDLANTEQVLRAIGVAGPPAGGPATAAPKPIVIAVGE